MRGSVPWVQQLTVIVAHANYSRCGLVGVNVGWDQLRSRRKTSEDKEWKSGFEVEAQTRAQLEREAE